MNEQKSFLKRMAKYLGLPEWRIKSSPNPLHPRWDKQTVENYKSGNPTCYLVSTLNSDTGARLDALFRKRDGCYYPEKPEFEKIRLGQGQYAHLPHSMFDVFWEDGKPHKLKTRGEKDL